MFIINRFKEEILRSKSLILITLISLFLLVPSIFAAPNKPAETQEKVLGVTKEASSPSPTPSPTPLPSPKSIVLLPTPTLSVTATPTPTPTPTPSASSSNPSPTITPTPTPTPSPSPSPVGLNIHIGIDYADQKSNDSYSVSVNPGQKAWDAVVQAVGINNIQYDQYDFGKFITGFNGVSADPNSQYYEFKVNGVASVIGVSDYECKDGDILDFVLTTFN